jgi:hypothetical protein
MSNSPLAGQRLGATTVNELNETVTGAAKTSFAIDYSPGFPAIVAVNGIVLATSDYDQTSGTAIVLGVEVPVGHHIHIVAFKVLSLYGSYTKAEEDALLALKLSAIGGTYTAVKETQLLTLESTDATTQEFDYSLGQTQLLTISAADAFSIDFTNWPTTEAGAMTLIVKVAAGVTFLGASWNDALLANTGPDFTSITADTGYGIYQIFFGAGNYYIFVVEEA